MAGVVVVLGQDAAFGVSVRHKGSRDLNCHCVPGVRKACALADPLFLAVVIMDDGVPCAAAVAGARPDDFWGHDFFLSRF